MRDTMDFLNQFSGEKITTATVIILLCILAVYIINRFLKKFFKMNREKYSRKAEEVISLLICAALGLTLLLTVTKIFDVAMPGTLFLLVFLVTTISTAGKLIADNLSNGLLVKSKGLYNKGDYVNIGSIEGYVEEITFNYTVISTSAGEKVYIPSSNITSDQISVIKPDDTYLVIESIPVNSSCEPDTVISDLKEVVESIPLLLKDEEFYVGITSLKSNIAEYECDMYCRFKDRYDMSFYFNKAVLEMMHKKNYPSAFLPFALQEMQNNKDSKDS